LTLGGSGCILKEDADGLFSLHYQKSDTWHRRPLWREDGNTILIMDPGSKREVNVGWVIHPMEGLLIAVLRHI
jgi:hypothetical protein